MPFQRTGNLRPSPQIDLFLTTVPTNRAMTLSTTKTYQLSSPIAQTHPSKPVIKVSPPLPSDHLLLALMTILSCTTSDTTSYSITDVNDEIHQIGNLGSKKSFLSKRKAESDAFSDNKATAHRCIRHVIMNMNPIIGNPFALLAFTFAENLETIFIASDSKDEYLDAIQNVEALDSREFNRYRRKGTLEHNKQVYKDKSSKNMRNVILKDINISVNVGSECHVYNLTVDCSKLHLKEINSSWFTNNTEMILLNDNLLTQLVNSTFVHFSHLTHLDLSNNEILLIDLLAFDGLTSLKYLSLRHNSISFNEVSTNILKPLNNLQLLDLIQQPSAGITDVPVSLLQSLTKLRTLAINTFNSTLYFGPEFLNLTHLEVLEITGSTRNVTESSFKNVNGLKELIVRDMPLLKRMDDKVFVHLDKLTSLTLAFDYKTDVYIGYSEEDYRFPCIELREHLERNLKLSTFLIDRDLLASLDKASGIMDAINSCWRVLLVCSKSFLTDEDWSMFTLRSAMYAQNPSNPARIVLMVHTSCLFLLPTELLSVVNDENILVVSEWKINYILSEMLRTRLMA
ncbi:TLR cluster1 member 18 [Biomphalaria glabrata]